MRAELLVVGDAVHGVFSASVQASIIACLSTDIVFADAAVTAVKQLVWLRAHVARLLVVQFETRASQFRGFHPLKPRFTFTSAGGSEGGGTPPRNCRRRATKKTRGSFDGHYAQIYSQATCRGISGTACVTSSRLRPRGVTEAAVPRLPACQAWRLDAVAESQPSCRRTL